MSHKIATRAVMLISLSPKLAQAWQGLILQSLETTVQHLPFKTELGQSMAVKPLEPVGLVYGTITQD
jgi:hypothetical protein